MSCVKVALEAFQIADCCAAVNNCPDVLVSMRSEAPEYQLEEFVNELFAPVNKGFIRADSSNTKNA